MTKSRDNTYWQDPNIGYVKCPRRQDRHEEGPTIRQEPGATKSIPRGYERFQSFSGHIIESFVPPKELQAVYQLNDPNGFGRRTPIDWVSGPQMSAELKMVLEYWDVDRLSGRVIICPVGNRNRERLHKFIEWAYTAEAVVNEVGTLWKKIFKR